MIQANELRIGNYIFSTTILSMSTSLVDATPIHQNEIKKVIALSEYYATLTEGLISSIQNGYNPIVPLKELTPIPLTEEWLLQFGFDKGTSECEQEREIWSIQVANNTSLYFDGSHDTKRWYLSHEWNNNHFQNDFWGCPKYVHQLQNLYFALTGEELKINDK